VLEKINEVLEPHLFPPNAEGTDPRICPNCGNGRLSMRTARSGGAFIGCSNYPECRYTRPFGPPGVEGDGAADGLGPDGKMLGVDPDSSQAVWLKTGRFGPYVQLGDVDGRGAETAARLPAQGVGGRGDGPREGADAPEPAAQGGRPPGGRRTGGGRDRALRAYVKHGRIYANLPEVDEVFTVGMNRAVELIAAKAAGRAGRGAAAAPLKELGEHPGEGGPVNVMSGRYGPYVKWGKVNATLPKDLDPQDVTLERAVELIAEKAGQGRQGQTRRRCGERRRRARPGRRIHRFGQWLTNARFNPRLWTRDAPGGPRSSFPLIASRRMRRCPPAGRSRTHSDARCRSCGRRPRATI
jgi:DNA topoisomerase-1